MTDFKLIIEGTPKRLWLWSSAEDIAEALKRSRFRQASVIMGEFVRGFDGPEEALCGRDYLPHTPPKRPLARIRQQSLMPPRGTQNDDKTIVPR
jgi:hypothetical protein